MFLRSEATSLSSMPEEIIITILSHIGFSGIVQVRILNQWFNKITTRFILLYKEIAADENILKKLQNKIFYPVIKNLSYYQITQTEFINIINYPQWSPKKRLIALLQIADKEDINHSDIVRLIADESKQQNMKRYSYIDKSFSLIEKLNAENTRKLVNQIIEYHDRHSTAILPHLQSQHLSEIQVLNLLDKMWPQFIECQDKADDYLYKINKDIEFFLKTLLPTMQRTVYSALMAETNISAKSQLESYALNWIDCFAKKSYLHRLLASPQKKLSQRVKQQNKACRNKLLPLAILLPKNDSFELEQLFTKIFTDFNADHWDKKQIVLALGYLLDKLPPLQLDQFLVALLQATNNYYRGLKFTYEGYFSGYFNDFLDKTRNLKEDQVTILIRFFENYPSENRLINFIKLAPHCNNHQIVELFRIAVVSLGHSELMRFSVNLTDKHLSEVLKNLIPNMHNLKFYYKLLNLNSGKFPKAYGIFIKQYENKFCIPFYAQPEMLPKKRVKKFLSTLNHYSSIQVNYLFTSPHMTKYAIKALDKLTSKQIVSLYKLFLAYYQPRKEEEDIALQPTFENNIFIIKLLQKLNKDLRHAWLIDANNTYFLTKQVKASCLGPIIINYLMPTNFDVVLDIFIRIHAGQAMAKKSAYAGIFADPTILLHLCLNMTSTHIHQLLIMQQTGQIELPFVVLEYIMLHEPTICKNFHAIFSQNEDFLKQLSIKYPSALPQTAEFSLHQVLTLFFDPTKIIEHFKNIAIDQSAHAFSTYINLCKNQIPRDHIEFMINVSYKQIKKGHASINYFDILKSLPTPIDLYFDLFKIKTLNVQQYLYLIKIILQLKNLNQKNCQIIFDICYDVLFHAAMYNEEKNTAIRLFLKFIVSYAHQFSELQISKVIKNLVVFLNVPLRERRLALIALLIYCEYIPSDHIKLVINTLLSQNYYYFDRMLPAMTINNSNFNLLWMAIFDCRKTHENLLIGNRAKKLAEYLIHRYSEQQLELLWEFLMIEWRKNDPVINHFILKIVKALIPALNDVATKQLLILLTPPLKDVNSSYHITATHLIAMMMVANKFPSDLSLFDGMIERTSTLILRSTARLSNKLYSNSYLSFFSYSAAENTNRPSIAHTNVRMLGSD